MKTKFRNDQLAVTTKLTPITPCISFPAGSIVLVVKATPDHDGDIEVQKSPHTFPLYIPEKNLRPLKRGIETFKARKAWKNVDRYETIHVKDL